MPLRLCLVAGLFATLSVALPAADWRQFRGNDSTGVAAVDDVPLSWSENENVAWKVPLKGRGLSGPIVVGDRVYVTCSSGPDQSRLHVVCFDVADGKTLWERQFWATGSTTTHDKTCVAAPTPASDGERIFAFYSSNDLACLDLDGNLLWFRGLMHDYPNARNSLGMASSPVVVGETVVVQVESDDDAFAVGLDVHNGLERWKIARPRKANWSSPLAVRGERPKDDRVLLQSSSGIAAVVPQTGDIDWSFDRGASTVSSSVLVDGTVYAAAGGITAFKPPIDGGEPEILWQAGNLAPSTASPLVDQGRVFTLNSAGVLNAADAATGKRLWQLRLEGPFTSTPVAAGGHLYLFNEAGKGQVVKPGDQRGEFAGGGELGETILCTPAIADGALYVRSDGHLWKIAR